MAGTKLKDIFVLELLCLSVIYINKTRRVVQARDKVTKRSLNILEDINSVLGFALSGFEAAVPKSSLTFCRQSDQIIFSRIKSRTNPLPRSDIQFVSIKLSVYRQVR